MPLCESFNASEASASYQPQHSIWFDRQMVSKARKAVPQPIFSAWIEALLRGPWLGPSSSATTTFCFQGLASLKEKGARIPEVSAIAMYLGRYPDLLPIVTAMSQKTLEVFQTNAQVSLEMVWDREYDDHFPALFVRFEQYPEEILDLIEPINRAFDGDRAKSDGWFYVTTDFQGPE